LSDRKIAIAHEVDTKKQAYAGDAAWALLADAERVVVASGKKVVEVVPSPATREELLALVTGRSGNIRAPAVQVGQVWYVGFTQEMYDAIG
jgi:hypothetical protein